MFLDFSWGDVARAGLAHEALRADFIQSDIEYAHQIPDTLIAVNRVTVPDAQADKAIALLTAMKLMPRKSTQS